MFRFGKARGRGRPVSAQGAVLTAGFDEDDCHTVHLQWTERQQPDLGGALNYSYDVLALPLTDILGPFVGARSGFRTVTPSVAYFQQAPVTGMGGTFVGTFQFQPLLDPNAAGSGIDVNDI